MKKLLHICLGILGSVAIAQAQNVGIGEAAPSSKLDIIQTETTGNSIEVNHNVTTNGSSAVWIRNQGTNRGLNVENLSATSSAEIARFFQGGNGAFADGLFVDMGVNTPASTSGLFINNLGLSFGGYALMDVANTNPAWVADHAGSGQGLFILQTGTGDGIYNEVVGGFGQINIIGSNSIGEVTDMTTAGGTGYYVDMDVQNGTGYYVLAVDNGTTPTAGGDVYSFFSNARTVTPTAAGTIYGSILAGNQSGVGHGAIITHSGVAGRNAEFNVTNPNNPDEAIFSVHNGQGSVIVGQNQNNALAGIVTVADFSYTGVDADDHVGVEGASTPIAGFGIGVLGTGNWYGVASQGDMTSTGVKPFTIDHPEDPANKMLKHFAIESNEVLNMYRGMIELDANGQAIVELPDYFESINKDYSYQLTAIGTAQHPYVKEEIEGNTFVVSGAPNTKVSWTVYADRNDAYMQAYPEKGVDVVEKEGPRKGKYFNPEFYDQPKESGMFYNPKHEGAKANTKVKLPSESLKKANNLKKELNRKTAAAKDKLEADVTSTK